MIAGSSCTVHVPGDVNRGPSQRRPANRLKSPSLQLQIVGPACLVTAVVKQSREDTSAKTKPLLPGAKLQGGTIDESEARDDSVVEAVIPCKRGGLERAYKDG